MFQERYPASSTTAPRPSAVRGKQKAILNREMPQLRALNSDKMFQFLRSASKIL
jgi:hypothetical protein